ncbi:hypothetical protein B4V02_03250 [Paenibacillus kribbensis]|jgi:hypothetical protein|uniref:Uncharacterized protein n=1 Tax=Paenibacillus kribbensis TaxID=172713 RepID=A0A222WJ10_9BACL|nr:hypothetical protein [Paenibacillus kribbensis]ASR45783.1 hypothetical protein B4V02_03250 [Paenibacillus kribbensis]
MNLEVTICPSLLEKCFDGFSDAFHENILLKEIKRRKIVIHQEIEDIYEDYIRLNRPELFDLYATFVSSILNNENYSKLIDEFNENAIVNSIFPHSKNNVVICSICNDTKDRILLSELINSTEKSELVKKLNINTFSSVDILDEKKSTILNLYKIPIYKRIPRGANSSNLSEWLGRFLLEEKEITIIDNYLYENSDNFYKYVLSKIDVSASVKLITKLNGKITERDIINKFKAAPFSSWNINEINIVSGKREQHARNIITENYLIMIDKGMAAFGTGKSNSTDQSDITIHYKNRIQGYSLPFNIRKII